MTGRGRPQPGRARLDLTTEELAWVIDRCLPAWQQQPDLVRYLKNKHAYAERKPRGPQRQHQADAPH